MTNSYFIKSGIDRNNKYSLTSLSLYLQKLEQTKRSFCRKLNEIIENYPKVLFESNKIDKETKFPLYDLGFIYSDKDIVGHLLCKLDRQTTDFGYKTSVSVLEEYSSVEMPEDYIDQYITGRLHGKLANEVKVDEKNNQK